MLYLIIIGFSFALFFRLFMLMEIPLGIVPIESAIITEAFNAIKNKEFLILAKDEIHWEMLNGYIFNLFLSAPRYISSILGILETFLLFVYFSKLSKRFAIIGALLLSLAPWHIYYTRILGICQHVNIFFLLSLIYSNNLVVSYFNNIVGLLYYITYRIALLRSFIHNFIAKKYKKMVVQLLSLATVLIIVILSQSSLYNYIFRGTNQIHSLKETFFNYFYTLIFSFTPILPYYHKLDFSSYFYESGVHDALTTSIFPFPPLGIASILAFLGIILFFKIKKYKKEGYIFLSIFLSLWILGGFAGPSFGRFTLFIPSLIFFATYFIDHFYKNKKVFYPLIILTLLSSILIDTKLILNLRNDSKMAPYFLPHIAKINQFLIEDNTPHKFIVARNYAMLIDYLATTKSKVIPIKTFDEDEYTKTILSKTPSVVIIPQIPNNYIRLYNGEQIFIDSIREKLLACALISKQGYLKDDPKNPVFNNQILGEYYYIEANNCVN